MKRPQAKKIAALIGSALALMNASAFAADLLTAYRDALAYDAQFTAARATVEAGREKLTQGRSGLLPGVSLSATSTWNEQETTVNRTQVKTPNNFNSSTWSVSLSQPLFRWQNWVSYNQSELAVIQAEAQFGVARQDLIVRVAQAYFDVLLAQEALTVAQAQKTAITEQLESAKRNFEVGTSTITDTHEAQSRYDLTIAQELAAQNDLAVKRHALAALTGKADDALKGLKSGVGINRPQPDDMAKWVEMAEASNGSVKIAQAASETASREIEKQRAGHLPTLDLVATRGVSTTTDSFSIPGGTSSKSSTIGVQLALPLFAGFGVVSKDREAVALHEKAKADLDNARRAAALGARQAFLGVTSGLAQVKAYEAALTSSQSALDSNKLGYEVGVRINIDVLNAQSQLYDTRQKLAKARLDTLAALLKLKAAAGNLTEEDVQSVNAMLE